jgi:hypothetical protein
VSVAFASQLMLSVFFMFTESADNKCLHVSVHLLLAYRHGNMAPIALCVQDGIGSNATLELPWYVATTNKTGVLYVAGGGTRIRQLNVTEQPASPPGRCLVSIEVASKHPSSLTLLHKSSNCADECCHNVEVSLSLRGSVWHSATKSTQPNFLVFENRR